MEYHIVGLDTGTTIAYALIDLNGNLVAIDSFKGTLMNVMEKIMLYGRVLIIGTDVAKTPRSIEKFASKVGASVVSPAHNLNFYEKRKKTKKYLRKYNIKVKNKHEMDALTSALIAYKHYNGLFNKINNQLTNKESLNDLKIEVLTNNIPIKKARELLGVY